MCTTYIYCFNSRIWHDDTGTVEEYIASPLNTVTTRCSGEQQ